MKNTSKYTFNELEKVLRNKASFQQQTSKALIIQRFTRGKFLNPVPFLKQFIVFRIFTKKEIEKL